MTYAVLGAFLCRFISIMCQAVFPWLLFTLTVAFRLLPITFVDVDDEPHVLYVSRIFLWKEVPITLRMVSFQTRQLVRAVVQICAHGVDNLA
jgi:hypothetical protein